MGSLGKPVFALGVMKLVQEGKLDLDNPLFNCDPNRVILTPHNIGHNIESGPAGAELAFENVARVLEGDLPRNVENREVIPAWQKRFGSAGARA